MVMPMTRGWLKFHGYMTVVCAIFTLVIGLSIWFETLKTRKNLSSIWVSQPASTQSLLQQRVRLQVMITNGRMLTGYSSIAVDTQTAHHLHLPLTPHARTLSLLQRRLDASVHFQASPITSWTWSSLVHSVS
jgi:hypothetical protein